MTINGFHPQEFQHPQLGPIIGRKRNEHVVQFRSIPYGHVTARFRHATLISELPPKQRTFTEYGHACPQTEQGMEPFGGPIPGNEKRQYDEFSCLNLTITAPMLALESGSTQKVPVMVYVHGGGFTVGAHYGGPNDTTKMVTQACEDSRPIIVDLVDEAAKLNKDPCNFALYDQRLAFQWVQKFISGFGGDINRITAFGESAGSSSLAFHLSSNVPLFDRAILQSGTASAISPKSIVTKEEEYKELLSFCGISRDDPQRLEKLRAVPTAKIVEAASSINKAAFSPLADESFFPIVPNYLNHAKIISECSWVNAVITGDTVFEGYLFAHNLMDVRPEVFYQHVEDALGAENAKRVLQVYEISRSMDKNLFWTRLCTLCGDVMFSLPCHILSKELWQSGKKQYRCILSLRNPFPGSFFSNILGHHFIELIYQFMTLMERLPLQRQRDVCVGFVRRWTAFAYGEEPWSQYTWVDEAVAVADSREGWVVRSRVKDMEVSVYDEGGQRRYENWEALDEVFRALGDMAPAAVEALSFPTLVTLGSK
ncbi:carboxylesterase type B [Fusarium mexicanum]|uniref:Carboxylesterase type B n=1 Tax=Fusarium mexicanum TaxID=751941 RepID=A0A8H5IMB8_9HYPO|nr:carboxylesterase type B [Fusarium mexicanum]